MQDKLIINGKPYEVSGVADDGLPILKASTTSVQDGFDAQGYPKISVLINVPSAPLSAVPGQNG